MRATTASPWDAKFDHDAIVSGRSVDEQTRSIPLVAPLADADDPQLIERVAAKDQQAFTLLYRRYAARLGRFLSKLLKKPELVDEAINDTMLVVWNKASQFDPERAKLSTWLFGIAYYAGLKVLRGSANATLYPLPDLEQEEHQEDQCVEKPEATVFGWELGCALKAAIDQLSTDHRAVIELTFVEGFSYSEIAKILGCPANTVKTRMFYARRQLKALLAHIDLGGR